jgi:hypothetical protein
VIAQVAVQLEGGHLVADGLLRARRGLPDRLPDLLKDVLHVVWKAGDVIVDSLGR